MNLNNQKQAKASKNNMKIISTLIATTLAVFSISAFAKEPTNLHTAKVAVIRYHDSGEYEKDISAQIDKALVYLKSRLVKNDFHGKKPAVVLDIDETSLSNYANLVRLDFGGTLDEIRADEDKGNDAVIAPTLKLYQFAIAHHVDVFFITGRQENERQDTINNLQNVGYANWKQLTLRDDANKTKLAEEYKTPVRKQITEQGYDIILNIGDQQSDLNGGYADKTIKLPNPYYFIP